MELARLNGLKLLSKLDSTAGLPSEFDAIVVDWDVSNF
jgi:hypothetical protein